MTTKHSLTRWAGLLAASAIVFAACSSTGGGASVAPSTAASAAASEGATDPMESLIAAAKAEGTLTAIALPDDWCNYGEVITTFKAKYGIEVKVLDPGASSGVEIEAIKANMDNPGPQAPDVVDVGFSFGEDNKARQFLDLPNPQVGGRVPRLMAATDSGAREVEALLYRFAFGDYS